MVKAIAAPSGAETVALRHDSASSCSVDGIVYAADDDGMVRVPAAAVAALRAHGFVPLPPHTRIKG